MIKRAKILMSTALILLIYGLAIVLHPNVNAQSSQIIEEVWKNSARVNDLNETVKTLQQRVQSDESKMDTLSTTLAEVKTTSETSNKLIMGSLAGMILMLIERGLSLRRRKNQDE